MKPFPTPKRLREVFDYCPTTGLLSRKSSPGLPAGRLNSGGYLLVFIDGHSIGVHRVAFAMHMGRWPQQKLIIHHRDGVRTNNTWDNLVETTSTVNNLERKMFVNNTSGFRGVSRHKGSPKWEASIKRNGYKLYLGLHDTPEEASRFYELARQMFKDLDAISQSAKHFDTMVKGFERFSDIAKNLAEIRFVPLNPCEIACNQSVTA